MELHPIFRRYPELKELFNLFRNEIMNQRRPANEIILNDRDAMRVLKISKRKLDYLKSQREIPFHQPRRHSTCYYLLSDILDWLKSSRMESIHNERRI